MNELGKRVLVATVFAPLLIAIIWLGGIYYDIFFGLVALISLKEYYGMGKSKTGRPQTVLGMVYGFLILVTVYISYEKFASPEYYIFAIVSFFVFLWISFLIELNRTENNAIFNLSTTAFGVVYCVLPFITLKFLRNIDGLPAFDNPQFNEPINDAWGYKFVIIFFVSIWLSDSLAYLFGKKIGKHKLAPRLSPNKTWEGAIAYFFTSLATMIGMTQFMFDSFSIFHALALGSIVGVFGQFGDLAESLLKRDAAIKDSSNILPGHGGILDRFDGVMFAAPAAAVYMLIVLFFNA